MATSSPKPKPAAKAIGRPLEYLKRAKREGIPPTTVGLIVILVAVGGFFAGMRFDDYDWRAGLNSTNLNQELPEDLSYESVEEVYDTLRQHFDGLLTVEQLIDGLKHGLATATDDPYTTYLNREQAEQFNDDLNGVFSGIGAEIGKEGEFITIVAPLKGFPAEDAGLKSGDIVLSIDGEDAVGLTIDEAVLKIRGDSGTEVMLTILRGDEQLEFSITRATITVPSVSHEVTSGSIGVLSVSRFSDDTLSLARKAVTEFLASDVKGIVLDLRGNSGGYLSAAVDVASFWLDGLLVAEQRENDGKKVVDSYKAARGAPLKGVKTVVLIDGGSASASEIVAGALMDHQAATVMGQTSYGKGSVQALESLSDGSVLKITIARWYTPKGKNIDQSGIKPEIEVEYQQNEADPEADNQLEAAIKYLST